jgi:hypothetical protein
VFGQTPKGEEPRQRTVAILSAVLFFSGVSVQSPTFLKREKRKIRKNPSLKTIWRGVFQFFLPFGYGGGARGKSQQKEGRDVILDSRLCVFSFLGARVLSRSGFAFMSRS